MQTGTQGDAPAHAPSSPHRRPGRRGGLTFLLLLLLLIGGVAFLFRPQASVGSHPLLIRWQQVLPHYAVETLVAAPSDANVLYACALPSSTAPSQDQSSSSIFLRSRDAGEHWQILPASLGDNATCSIAVNPDNANDLYLSVMSPLSSMPAVFKHSLDGGKTWTTLRPTLVLSAPTQTVAWQGGRVSFVDHRLFAVQLLQGIAHLMASSDGGQTWTTLDAPVTNAHQELLSYAVDPTAPSMLYELIGEVAGGWFSSVPSQGTPPPMPSPVPVERLVRHLYKTVDGGKTWQELLSSVPYGASLQLAWSHPTRLYLGGLIGKASAPSQRTFQMQSSADGGRTWQPVALPTNAHLINNWLVDATGVLYVTDIDADTHPTHVASLQRYDPSDQQ
jgi:hypothetical protein